MRETLHLVQQLKMSFIKKNNEEQDQQNNKERKV